MRELIKDKIRNADLVLVGIGEEFDGLRWFRQIPEYAAIKEKLETEGTEWLIPVLNRFFLKETAKSDLIKSALGKLSELLVGKNYFLVSVSTNDDIWEAGFKEERVVAPCGGTRKKQCSVGKNCHCKPSFVSDAEIKGVEVFFDECTKIQKENAAEAKILKTIGNDLCPVCGSTMIFNNIYTESYDERGYLEQWQKYTKWLQGTLNKKLCIMELGVGMQCPGVIRFPFEKIGYFNQKADFIRVHQNLYQLTEELSEKGISISENAVDWLTSMW